MVIHPTGAVAANASGVLLGLRTTEDHEDLGKADSEGVAAKIILSTCWLCT
jgi:hypothetical protein